MALIGYVGLYLPWFLYGNRTIFTFYTVAFVPFVVLVLVLALGSAMGMLAPVPGSHEAAHEKRLIQVGWIGEGRPHPRGALGAYLGFGARPSRMRLSPEWTGVPTWRLHGEGVVLTAMVVLAAIVFALLWWPGAAYLRDVPGGMRCDVNLISEKGTHIVLNFTQPTTAEEYRFLRFVDPKSSRERTASSTACLFNTGSIPGKPKSISCVLLFGSALRASLSAGLNSLVLVASWTWHSMPMVISYCCKISSDTAIRLLLNLSMLVCKRPERGAQYHNLS